MGQADANNPGLWFTGYGILFQGFFHAAGISARRIADSIASQSAQPMEAHSKRPVAKARAPKTLSLKGLEQ